MKINEPKYKFLKGVIAFIWFMVVLHIFIAFILAFFSFVSYTNLFLLSIGEWFVPVRFLYAIVVLCLLVISINEAIEDEEKEGGDHE